MSQCFEDEIILRRCKMHPQLPKFFMEVMKGYYNMSMLIFCLASVICRYNMQLFSKCDKLSLVKISARHTKLLLVQAPKTSLSARGFAM